MATLAYHFEEGGRGMYPIVMCQVAVAALLLGRALALARSIGPREKLTRVVASHLAQEAKGKDARVSLDELREILNQATEQWKQVRSLVAEREG